jgi:hypothetical protein
LNINQDIPNNIFTRDTRSVKVLVRIHMIDFNLRPRPTDWKVVTSQLAADLRQGVELSLLVFPGAVGDIAGGIPYERDGVCFEGEVVDTVSDFCADFVGVSVLCCWRRTLD